MKKSTFIKGIIATITLVLVVVNPVSFLNALFTIVPESSMTGQEVFLGLAMAAFGFAVLGMYVLSFWNKAIKRAIKVFR